MFTCKVSVKRTFVRKPLTLRRTTVRLVVSDEVIKKADVTLLLLLKFLGML
jgi:hypothetical protein